MELKCATSVARFAGSVFLGCLIPGLRSLRFAHPGLPYAAALRLVDVDIYVDAALS